MAGRSLRAAAMAVMAERRNLWEAAMAEGVERRGIMSVARL